MSMIANKIVPKLKKAIAKYGVDVEAYRESLNEYGEPSGQELVTSFKGLYSESSNMVTKQITDTGHILKDNQSSLICLIENATEMLLKGDILLIKGISFEVLKVDNSNLLDAYYDILLEKVK